MPLARVAGAGGKGGAGRPPPEGMGYFAHIIDSEGNRVRPACHAVVRAAFIEGMRRRRFQIVSHLRGRRHHPARQLADGCKRTIYRDVRDLVLWCAGRGEAGVGFASRPDSTCRR